MRPWPLLLLLTLTACGPLWVKLTDDTGLDDTPPVDSEPEGDTDTDADSDTDSDADSDSDADTDTAPVDADGDGYTEDVDCDDDDETVHPDAEEICGDGVDNDCDGAATGCGLSGDILASEADATLLGEESDASGWSIAGVGDVDNDGFDDLLIGAPGHDGGAEHAGAAYLVPGPVSGQLDLESVGHRLDGEASSDGAGVAVAGAGDVNGDGVPDLLVGAWANDAGGDLAGMAYLVLGPVTAGMDLGDSEARLLGVARDGAGSIVQGAGDVNDDGFDDILVGATGMDNGQCSGGGAYLVLGPVSGDLSLEQAQARFQGEHQYGLFGLSIASADDTNGDGFDDIVVGQGVQTSDSPPEGAAYLFLGPTTGDISQSSADAVLVGEQEGDCFGSGLASAGDVDGDGYSDLLVGSRSHGGTGAAYLVLGPISADQDLSDAHAKLVGEPGSSAGESISGAGDVNLDGFDDLIVGAAYRQADEDCEGAAYLVLGPVTGELELIEADARIYGEQFSGFLGFAVDSAGDVDGDGFGDIIVSANEHGLTQPDGAGATYLFLTPGL